MAIVGTAVVASYVAGTSLVGLLSGLVAALAVARLLSLRFFRMFDAMFYALPFGWFFLRAGCALVHDHVGVASEGPLAVAFPWGGA